ncbi:MAG TPA: hypothetical protein VLG47_07130 [Candidatus Saccharimonadales bacterium]|nr:hypothetical protein [Candidatus Saccharimonadales bacterium]
MRKIQNVSIARLFFVALASAALLFVLEFYLSDKINSGTAEIVTFIGLGLLASSLFVIGVIKSLHSKYFIWFAVNLLALLIIIGWTYWICLIIYTFSGFKSFLM